MATITLKINERSGFGKILLQMIKLGVAEKKGVEILSERELNEETKRAIADAQQGKTETISLEEFRKQLY